MNIMKRKNKSVAHARAIPNNLIGGNQTLITSRLMQEGIYK